MTNFEKSFDVIIAGAGVAGVAAALETARAGLRTALVEKTTLVGGLATSGLINMYLPLCDGQGHQVIYGIAEELLHLSIKYGPGDIPPTWEKSTGEPPDDIAESMRRPPQPRYRTPFSPASFVLALDEALEQAGVDLWLDTLVCQAIVVPDGTQTPNVRRIVGIEVENKSGRGRLIADCIIDATGDADVAHRAGAPCTETDNWLSVWAIQSSLESARKAAADPAHRSLLDVLHLGASPEGHGMPPGIPKLYGTDGQQVTRYILESHRLLREHYKARTQSEDAPLDRHTLFPVALPTMAQFRTTRRIIGHATITSGQANAHVPTSVGLAPDWRKAGPVWEIPYGALIPRDVTGLLAAGRCISSESHTGDRDSPWEITRVIPAAALTGQVAGLAARLAIQQDTTPDAIKAQAMQRELSRIRLPFHIEDVR
jgi:hypothetical protein